MPALCGHIRVVQKMGTNNKVVNYFKAKFTCELYLVKIKMKKYLEHCHIHYFGYNMCTKEHRKNIESNILGISDKGCITNAAK